MLDDKVLFTITVYETDEYSKFKALVGQPRSRAKQNARKLVKSLKEHNGNVTPIQVNEAYEVIDGNTRLEGCRILGLPVKYVMTNSKDINSLELMRILNTTNTVWNLHNIVEFYAIGYRYERYGELLKFLVTNDINLSIFLALSNIEGKTLKFGEFKDVSIDWITIQGYTDTVLTVAEILSDVTDSKQNIARCLAPILRDGSFSSLDIIRAVSDNYGKLISVTPELASSTDIKPLILACLGQKDEDN